MLVAVKKGKKINEEEIPPLVASGKSSAHIPQATGAVPEPSSDPAEVSEQKVESPAGHELKSDSNVEQSVKPASPQGHDAVTAVLETGTTLLDNKQFQHISFWGAPTFRVSAYQSMIQGYVDRTSCLRVSNCLRA